MFLIDKSAADATSILAGIVTRNAASTEKYSPGAIRRNPTAQIIAGTDIKSVISIYTVTVRILLSAVPKRRCIIRFAPIKTKPKPILAAISDAVRVICSPKIKCTGMKHITLSTATLGICSHIILISFLKGFSGMRYT
jgi:hypothetical protein